MIEHKIELRAGTDNAFCSCGQVFSIKGIKIHIGMMNKKLKATK